MTDKHLLRGEMLARRSACADRDARDDALFRRVVSSNLYREADCILCYVSFGSEADTHRLLRQILSDGKRLYVPRCVPGTNQMEFYRVTSLDTLQPGAYGILEPPETERFAGNPSAVCLVPGLAFTVQGQRIGYGKGYYDTFLEKTGVCAIGLCYDFQIVPAISSEAHDRAMDYIITDQNLYASRKDGK